MATKQRGLLSSVILISLIVHVVIAVVFTLVKVAQALIEPEPDFVAVTPPTLDTQKKEKKVEASKRQRQSGGSPPKVVITSNAPSTFEVPMVDVKVSNPNGSLGGRGEGTGLGEGFGPGAGRGIGGRLGGSVFGYTQGLDTDMSGSFFDFKQSNQEKPITMDVPKYTVELEKFLAGSWNTSELREYYKAPKNLFLTHLAIPSTSANAAPAAYGVADKVKPSMWIAFYEGYIEAPVSGQYRFIGQGDDTLVVKLGKKVVLDASWSGWKPSGWKGSGDPENRKWNLGNNKAEIGNWFTLQSGESVPLQIVVGERPGGAFCQILCIEKKGEKTPTDTDGRPIWDLFKVDELSKEEKATLSKLTGGQKVGLDGPVFKARSAPKR